MAFKNFNTLNVQASFKKSNFFLKIRFSSKIKHKSHTFYPKRKEPRHKSTKRKKTISSSIAPNLTVQCLPSDTCGLLGSRGLGQLHFSGVIHNVHSLSQTQANSMPRLLLSLVVIACVCCPMVLATSLCWGLHCK